MTQGVQKRASPTRRLLEMFKPVWVGALGGVLLSVPLGLVLLSAPLLFGRIIDVRLKNGDFRGLLLDSGLVLASFVAYLFLLVASRYVVLKTTKNVIMRLRSEVVLKLQQLSISFYDSENLGLLHSRVIQDTERVDVMANFMVATLMVSALQFVGAVVVLWLKNWQLTLLLLVIALAFWGLQALFKSRIKVKYGHWRGEFDSFSAKVQDLLQGIRLVRAFATEDRQARDMIETAASLSDRGVQWVTTMALFNGLVKLLTGVSMTVVLLVGGWFCLKGSLSLGTLVVFFATLNLVFDPLSAILNNLDQLFGGQVALEQVFDLLDHPDIEPDRAEGLVKPLVGRVEFRGVDFTYPAGHPALVGASMSAAPGQTVALVGASGAGKTTFVSLLLGFYHPSAGQVLIDDVPLEQFQTRPLRAQMAVVAQENLLLAGTVLYNVLYGRPDAGAADVERVCRMACAWDFIQQLPHGLDTEVGDRGVMLSGGQKQRLAIARALLRDPRILILDEATSALDSVSERAFQQALENMRNQRTTFIIAHRLSTVKNADQVLVFDQGRIIERGTHQELLELEGTYARLFQAQFQPA